MKTKEDEIKEIFRFLNDNMDVSVRLVSIELIKRNKVKILYHEING